MPALTAATFPAEALRRAAAVRALILDVDGVLTDGRIYVGEHGESVKAFNTLDGHGIKSLAALGVAVWVITGRDSPAVRRRVADLGIPRAAYGVHDKRAVAEAFLAESGLGWDALAAMGDDWPDLPLLHAAALALAPAQAHAELAAVAHHVTARPGGHGAVREACDLILIAQGAYERLLQALTRTLDDGRTAV